MELRMILDYEPVNSTDEEKVIEIMESIKTNGWIGFPILTYGNTLVTGSHRLEALSRLAEEDESYYDLNVSRDVTDEIEEYIEAYYEENEEYPSLDFSDLREIFQGTWVENYKDELKEW